MFTRSFLERRLIAIARKQLTRHFKNSSRTYIYIYTVHIYASTNQTNWITKGVISRRNRASKNTRMPNKQTLDNKHALQSTGNHARSPCADTSHREAKKIGSFCRTHNIYYTKQRLYFKTKVVDQTTHRESCILDSLLEPPGCRAKPKRMRWWSCQNGL